MEKKTTAVGSAVITGYDGEYIFRTIESSGDFYEAALLNKWTPLLGQPRTILDLGANIGNHTVYWGTKLQAKRILSFEPFPENYSCLCDNVNNNGLTHVTPLQMAAGDHHGTVKVEAFNPENLGGTTFAYGTENGVGVPAVPVDALAEEYDLTDVDFVKIDTEGFELKVLQGMKNLLFACHPVLWIEAGKETILQVMELLLPLGYELCDFSGANVLLFPSEMSDKGAVTRERLLEAYFVQTDRANAYYGNYMTAKTWLANKDRRLEEKDRALSEKTDELAEKERALSEAAEAHAEQEARENLLREELIRAHEDYGTACEVLEDAQRTIRRLQVRNEELQQKANRLQEIFDGAKAKLNAERKKNRTIQKKYKALDKKHKDLQKKHKEISRKLNVITGSWWGKLGIRVYRVLRKIKHKLFAR